MWPVSARGVITAIRINAALTALCQRRKCAAARHTLMLMGIVLYQPAESLTLQGLNEAACAAVKGRSQSPPV